MPINFTRTTPVSKSRLNGAIAFIRGVLTVVPILGAASLSGPRKGKADPVTIELHLLDVNDKVIRVTLTPEDAFQLAARIDKLLPIDLMDHRHQQANRVPTPHTDSRGFEINHPDADVDPETEATADAHTAHRGE